LLNRGLFFSSSAQQLQKKRLLKDMLRSGSFSDSKELRSSSFGVLRPNLRSNKIVWSQRFFNIFLPRTVDAEEINPLVLSRYTSQNSAYHIVFRRDSFLGELSRRRLVSSLFPMRNSFLFFLMRRRGLMPFSKKVLKLPFLLTDLNVAFAPDLIDLHLDSNLRVFPPKGKQGISSFHLSRYFITSGKFSFLRDRAILSRLRLPLSFSSRSNKSKQYKDFLILKPLVKNHAFKFPLFKRFTTTARLSRWDRSSQRYWLVYTKGNFILMRRRSILRSYFIKTPSFPFLYRPLLLVSVFPEVNVPYKKMKSIALPFNKLRVVSSRNVNQAVKRRHSWHSLHVKKLRRRALFLRQKFFFSLTFYHSPFNREKYGDAFADYRSFVMPSIVSDAKDFGYLHRKISSFFSASPFPL